MATELLLSINQFNQPKTVKSVDADALLVATLMTMRPGTNPVHPDMGFNISGKRFNELEDNIMSIQNDFRSHCSKYLPHIYIDEMQVRPLNKKTLLIGVKLYNNGSVDAQNFILKVKEEKGILLTEILN